MKGLEVHYPTLWYGYVDQLGVCEREAHPARGWVDVARLLGVLGDK